ncbi:MAG TPA: DUF222 domain-containing protein [Nocardioidaceae bacterium]|nr:DUF222 domain-containing protein [Nocardioidaceae bacterium]
MTTTQETASDHGLHAITRCTGSLLAALGQAGDAPAWSMSGTEQRAVLAELTRAEAMLTELRLRVLAAADAADIAAETAASSTAAWVAHETRQTRAAAHADVRLAKALDGGFETTRKALAGGRLNLAQARVIVEAVEALPDDAPGWVRGAGEAHLVEQAQTFDAKALRVLGRCLLEVVDPEAAEAAEGEKLEKEEREARRRTVFRIRDNGDGTHSGSFKLPTLQAAMLAKALQALSSPRRVGPAGRLNPDGTPVPSPVLMGRAFAELVEHLPSGDLPGCTGLNATVVVTMSLDTLLGGVGAASLDTGDKISAGEARRLACAAGVIPVVLGGESMPLDVGRERRFHTRYQRIAMAQRDGGCTVEDCDRPPGWCEAHHDGEHGSWAEGGGTSVAQGRLLCRWHHQRAHDPAYRMHRMPSGRVRFTRRQ